MSNNPLFTGTYKKFTREEEAALCKKMREGDLGAKDQLFKSCIPWTITISRKVAENSYGKVIDEAKLDDVIQAGLCGLLESLKRFDPTKGRLTTYARWYIRKECLTWVWKDKTIYLPRYLSGKKFKEFSVPFTMSLVVKNEDGCDITPKGLTYDHKEFEEVDAREEGDSLLKSNMVILTEREKGVLFLRSNGMTLKQIGVRYGLCKERVRQIQNKAIESLRTMLKQEGKV